MTFPKMQLVKHLGVEISEWGPNMLNGSLIEKILLSLRSSFFYPTPFVPAAAKMRIFDEWV